MKTSFILGLLVLFASAPLTGQTEFALDSAVYSVYMGDTIPAILYQFEPDERMDDLRDKILSKTGKQENFQLIRSNVASIAAVLSKGKRYVLYNRSFFDSLNSSVATLALLAQAIGHCVQEHTFDPERIEEENVEADEFTGYALCLMGKPIKDVSTVALKWPRKKSLDALDQQAAIVRGFYRAEASLWIAAHASWSETTNSNALDRFPRFPFPAPGWSADADLDAYFVQSKTLSDADKKICRALDGAGFYGRKYFQVPGGFAVVTQMEQFNSDGSSMSKENRWKSRPVRNETFSIADYFTSIFTTEPGYFRVFAFLVTDEVMTADKYKKVSREEAINWLSEGAFRLPKEIGAQQYGKNTGVTALVYEFRVPESNREPVFAKPSELPGITHLRKALILKSLEK